MSKVKKMIYFAEILWPYRPDLLIRIDFLQWFHEVKGDYFSKSPEQFLKEDISGNIAFFEAAKMHPYFLQFTRKRRYRRLNLNKQKSESVYAEGIASFINLFQSIKEKEFDRSNKICLRKTIVLKNPSYGKKVRRKYYMADGCHRLACVAWLGKKTMFPKEIFNIQHNLVWRPTNAFGIFRKLNITNREDEVEYDYLFKNGRNASWKQLSEWSGRIRNRFRTVDVDEVLKIKFHE